MKKFNKTNIDDFLLGRLNHEDEAAFNEQLRKDIDLTNEVNDQKKAIDLIETHNDLELKRRIQTIGEDYKNNDKPKTIHIYQWLAVAAGILGFIFFLNQIVFSPQQNKDTFALYFSDYPLSFNTRGDNIALLSDAGNYYKLNNYENALTLFKKSLEEKDRDKVRIGMAVCLLNLNNPLEAIEVLEPLIQNNSILYKPQAHWYTALSYLKLEDLAMCKMNLKRIKANDYFFDKAQELLATLHKKNK